MMEQVKALYYKFLESDDFDKLGNFPEVDKACDDYYRFMGNLFKGDDFRPVEQLLIANNVSNQVQWFCYGFRYAVQIMTECMSKGDISCVGETKEGNLL